MFQPQNQQVYNPASLNGLCPLIVCTRRGPHLNINVEIVKPFGNNFIKCHQKYSSVWDHMYWYWYQSSNHHVGGHLCHLSARQIFPCWATLAHHANVWNKEQLGYLCLPLVTLRADQIRWTCIIQLCNCFPIFVVCGHALHIGSGCWWSGQKTNKVGKW